MSNDRAEIQHLSLGSQGTFSRMLEQRPHNTENIFKVLSFNVFMVLRPEDMFVF